MRTLALAGVVLTGLVMCAVALAAPPSNDDRSAATPLALPSGVSGTTVEATLEDSEPFSSCQGTLGSVWYSVRTDADRRVALQLSANGDLDAAIDVYSRTRSQLVSIGCDLTDRDGDAALAFVAKKDTNYLVRVSRRVGSVAGSFDLNAFAPRPPARPPGGRLSRGGARGSLDRLQNTDDAFSVSMAAGRSYRVNLAPRRGLCLGLSLFGRGTRSFQGGALRQLRCGGYFLYTPGPGRGGRHSLLVESNDRARGPQRYRLDVAPAGPDDTLPGRRLGRSARGALNARGIDVIDLYRFDVVRRSNLSLRLGTRGAPALDLLLLRQSGRRLRCACGGSGGARIDRRVRPGRYYAAVRARVGARGRYRLRRVVRTITSTRVTIDGSRRAGALPGRPVAIRALVRPDVSGPVRVVVERLDPLFGFQFAGRFRARAVGGVAAVTFRPPAIGRYRARAVFAGTRSAAPSESGFAGLVVADPPRP